MANKNNFALFHEEWEKNRNKISAVLQKKYHWQRKNNNDLWMDILSEAKEVCLENFHEYENSGNEFGSFWMKWSQIALKRFLEKHNKITYGDRKFVAAKQNLQLLKQAVTDEGNPRFILAFILHYYLELKPREICDNGYPGKTLEEVFTLTKSGFAEKFCLNKKPVWFMNQTEGIFGILWDKIENIKLQPFADADYNFEISFLCWAKAVKKDFLTTDIKTTFLNYTNKNFNKLNPDYDQLIILSDFLHEYDEPEANHIRATSDDSIISEEKLDMYIKLLRYIIQNTEDLKNLFALLFTVCKVSQKQFIKRRYYLLPLEKLAGKFREDYLYKTVLAENKLNPVFSQLEKRIEKNKDEFIFKEISNINIPDWAYNARVSVSAAIFSGKGILGKELREYYLADH